MQALELLVEQSTGPLNRVIITLRDGIKEGRSLADGLARYPETFDSIYIQLVRAGEATGNLETILDRLNDFLERREELRKKVVGALRYPIFQLIVIVLVVIGLLAFVVPQIASVFQGQNITFASPTDAHGSIKCYSKPLYSFIWKPWDFNRRILFWKSTRRCLYDGCAGS